MAKVSYMALLDADADGVGVVFPDLDGCVSWGEDAHSAVRNAEEALGLHLEGMREARLLLPDPSPLQAITPDILARYFEPGAPVTYALVTVEAPDEAERVNVYLSRSLLQRVDRFARDAGLNRSAFFSQAAASYIKSNAEVLKG